MQSLHQVQFAETLPRSPAKQNYAECHAIEHLGEK
jgi:hypothetical protein